MNYSVYVVLDRILPLKLDIDMGPLFLDTLHILLRVFHLYHVLLIPENRLRSTVSEIIAENLVSNQKLEEDLWDNQKQQISDSVEPVVIKFFENDLINFVF